MQGEGVLLTIAEIAIGLAGFSGIVVSFSGSGTLPAADRIRFMLLVGSTFEVTMFSFVPFGFHLGGFDEESVWRWSSGIWLLVAAGTLPLILAARRAIAREGQLAPNWSVAVVGVVVMGAILAQVGNAVGWPYSPGPVPYIAGLLSGIVGSAAVFVYLVLVRATQSSPTPASRSGLLE